MQLEVLEKGIFDLGLLAQGYRFYDGYVFTAIRNPANVFDAILVRNPSNARRFGGKEIESIHSLCDHIEYINKYGIEKAEVIADNISFLNQCPTVKHINIIPSVTSGEEFDFSPLYAHPQIVSLRCSTKYGNYHERSACVDYSRIHGLEYLIVGTEYDLNFQCVPTLKTLCVSNYRDSDLHNLFCSTALDTLELNSCRLRTLDGLESASRIQCIYLANNRWLEDISKLAEVSKTLKALRIRKCARVQDFSVLSQLRNLEYLHLEGSNKIPSLDFLSSLPKLKTLVFDMDVQDGDLLPCIGLSYAHCGRIRKHYNVSAKELPKGDFYRGNENIELWRRIQ
jgi:hypothetical protein